LLIDSLLTPIVESTYFLHSEWKIQTLVRLTLTSEAHILQVNGWKVKFYLVAEKKWIPWDQDGLRVADRWFDRKHVLSLLSTALKLCKGSL